jgi:hypothetical protein
LCGFLRFFFDLWLSFYKDGCGIHSTRRSIADIYPLSRNVQ